MNSKNIGDISEAAITFLLLKQGNVVLKPYGDNQRYDLLIDDNGCFSRIQVKTGRYNAHKGTILFSTSSSQAHRGKARQTYVGCIEYFAVYCHELNKGYLIPIEVIQNKRMTTLRVLPSLVKQQYTDASKYEIKIDNVFDANTLEKHKKVRIMPPRKQKLKVADAELARLVAEGNNAEKLGKLFNVSGAAIRKRLKKIR